MKEKELQSINKYKIIKPGDLAELRASLHAKQGGICPILQLEIPLEDMVVDHQHRLNQRQEYGEDGAGLIRGCIQRHANALEGKVTNAWRRYGMDRYDITVSDFLRHLADYLERENLDIIHPSELPKPKYIKKSCYNKLKKVVGDKQKVPEYHKNAKGQNRQKLTKTLEALFNKYEIEVEFY